MIRLDQPLGQLVLFPHEVLDDLPELLTAVIPVALHLPQATLVLAEDDTELLVAPPSLNVGHHRVLDHLSVLAEPQGAESLLKLGRTGCDAEDYGCPGVSSKRGPQDFGQRGIPIGDVRIRGTTLGLSLECYHLGQEEEGFVNVLPLLDSQRRGMVPVPLVLHATRFTS